jgi:hypothetical protein
MNEKEEGERQKEREKKEERGKEERKKRQKSTAKQDEGKAVGTMLFPGRKERLWPGMDIRAGTTGELLQH